MKFHHVRHATSLLYYAGTRFLIDPCLSKKGALPAIPLTPNKRPNPLVELNTSESTLLNAEVVLSTHVHFDHFDSHAANFLPKEMPIICQSENVGVLNDYGFTNLLPISDEHTYRNIRILRTHAQHGRCVTEKLMGTTSGYILSAEGEPTVYITGDTIFNDTVKNNILQHRPELLILNGGSPKFLNSDPIVMNILDLEKTMAVNPELKFIVVHLDTFNHCIETREDLREYFSEDRLDSIGVKHLFIPEDNEILDF